jgi:chromate transporter
MSEIADADALPAAPRSARELFFAFNRLALQGFGGVLPVAQRELVENLGWLTKAEFLELLSIGQVLPGPNIVNMALIFGDRYFGWRGAFASLAGLLAAPLGIVLALALLVRQGAHLPWVADAMRGMGVVAAGLVVSTATKLSAALMGNRMGLATCIAFTAAIVFAIAWMRWPLVTVLALLVPAAWFNAWRKSAT